MMRPVGENLRIYVHRAPIDMRRGRNGLAALTQEVLKEDPFASGALFVFVGKNFDQTTFSIPIV
jgi:transposase